MKMKKWISVICAVALACAMLAGCGGQDDSAQTDAVSESVQSEQDNSVSEDDVSNEVSGQEETSENTGDDGQEETAPTDDTDGADIPEDGVYTAEFQTDSSMFHVNEAYDDRGTLTVENGEMTIHVTLVSKNIVNLYCGTAEEAQTDEAGWLEPTEDTVVYSDGTTEVVYGFDVPVAVLDEEFDLALIGTKGVWYDHKVSVSDVQPAE